MDKATQMDWGNLRSQDGETRYQAFMRLLETTKQPMDWAYEVWDELIANLNHKDNHQRAIVAFGPSSRLQRFKESFLLDE